MTTLPRNEESITIDAMPTRYAFQSDKVVRFHQSNGVVLEVDFGSIVRGDYVHIRAVSPDGKPVALRVTPQSGDEICVGGDVLA